MTLVLSAGVGMAIAARRVAARGAAALAPSPATSVPPVKPTPTSVVDFVGVLLPPLTVNVAPRIDGKLSKVDALLGSVLHRGDLLASLDARLEQHDLDMARATERAARAATVAARVEVDRSRDHVSRRRDTTVVVGNETLSLVSGEEAAQAKFDESSATAKLISSTATAAQEQRHVEQVSTLLDEHDLRAPFDCVVAARYLDPGAYVKAGEPVVRIVATGSMIVRFAVPEEAIGTVKMGDLVRIALDAKTLDAHVERISPEVEPASRTVFVEARAEGDGSVCDQGCSGLAGRVVRVALRGR